MSLCNDFFFRSQIPEPNPSGETVGPESEDSQARIDPQVERKGLTN